MRFLVFTRRPAIAIALVGLFTFVFSVAMFGWRIPLASNVDEFSNLLAADTFAHFRLANPTHALWVHFETIHVIQVPHYASKFPPLPGAIMAAGQVLFGQPIVGVWLSTSLACAAVCWMLMGCMSRRWAMLGGVLTAFHPIVLLWNQHYFASNLGVLGGALLIGSVLRIVRAPRARHGVSLAIGAAVLANTRPYEAVIMVAFSLVWLFVAGRNRPLRAALLPAALVLAGAAMFMGYYDWKVTGDPATLPYQVHEAQYDIAPPFWMLQAPRAPVYRHPSLQAFHTWEYACWKAQHDNFDTAAIWTKLIRLRHYPLSMLGLALILLPCALRNPVVRWAVAGIVFFVAAQLLPVWLNPNYTTPAAPLFFLITVQCLRYMNQLRFARIGRVGPVLVGAVVILCAASAVLSWHPIHINDSQFGETRARLLTQLSAQPEKQLVIVQYPPEHNIFAEWVYNAADIDAAHVVWAQDMGPQLNQELIRYYRDRKVHLVRTDE